MEAQQPKGFLVYKIYYRTTDDDLLAYVGRIKRVLDRGIFASTQGEGDSA